ncbi:unnamed protein product [Amoebophrya sp. A25]|nr:unnamed protein product [Amoebophrya sp. A25]|eukprot:GSA25T00003602001.1
MGLFIAEDEKRIAPPASDSERTQTTLLAGTDKPAGELCLVVPEGNFISKTRKIHNAYSCYIDPDPKAPEGTVRCKSTPPTVVKNAITHGTSGNWRWLADGQACVRSTQNVNDSGKVDSIVGVCEQEMIPKTGSAEKVRVMACNPPKQTSTGTEGAAGVSSNAPQRPFHES